jgi:hypothetical protein
MKFQPAAPSKQPLTAAPSANIVASNDLDATKALPVKILASPNVQKCTNQRSSAVHSSIHKILDR